MDHNCGRPEAQKMLIDPHFGQNFTPFLGAPDFGSDASPPSKAREPPDFPFLGFLRSRFFGSLGFRMR
jgi:hypothetical protein